MKDNQGTSAPKRYAVDTDAVMGLADHVVLKPAPDGEWVRWEDYERLERLLMESYEENRDLRRENTQLIMEYVL